MGGLQALSALVKEEEKLLRKKNVINHLATFCVNQSSVILNFYSCSVVLIGSVTKKHSNKIAKSTQFLHLFSDAVVLKWQ